MGLGWFGISSVWLLPMVWRYVARVMAGERGLKGPGTVRMWLATLAVLCASASLSPDLGPRSARQGRRGGRTRPGVAVRAHAGVDGRLPADAGRAALGGADGVRALVAPTARAPAPGRRGTSGPGRRPARRSRRRPQAHRAGARRSRASDGQRPWRREPPSRHRSRLRMAPAGMAAAAAHAGIPAAARRDLASAERPGPSRDAATRRGPAGPGSCSGARRNASAIVAIRAARHDRQQPISSPAAVRRRSAAVFAGGGRRPSAPVEDAAPAISPAAEPDAPASAPPEPAEPSPPRSIWKPCGRRRKPCWPNCAA